MENKFLDGREASLKARNYFSEVHGNFSVYAFIIESASFDTEKSQWIIVCNFFPSLATIYKVRYEVQVNAVDGTIMGVKGLALE